MGPSVESTIQRLDDVRQRWWFFSSLCGLLMAMTISVVTLVLAVLMDVFLQLPLGWLRFLFFLWLGTSAALLWHCVRRSIRHPRSLEGAARRIELAFPALDSSLINMIQLSRPTGDRSNPLRQSAIAEMATRAQQVPFHQAALKHSRWDRWRLGLQTPRDLAESMAAVGLMIGLIGLLAITLPRWSSSFERLLTPWRFVPQIGAVEIVEVTPGDTTVLLGAALPIRARIAEPEAKTTEAILHIIPEDGEEMTRPMLANAAGTVFRTSVPAVIAPLQYRLQIGDSETAIYHVKVLREPAFQDVEITYEYPPYLEQPALTVRQQHADLEAPQFTQAHLKLACTAPLAQGYAQTSKGRVHGQSGQDPRILKLRMLLSDQTSYTIHLLDQAGFANTEPRVNTIKIYPDNPPTVQLVKPSSDLSVGPNTEIELIVRAGDDHGLGEVRFEWKLESEEAASSESIVHPLHGWTDLAGSTSSTRIHHWNPGTVSMPSGRTVLIRAVAVDRRQLTWRGNRLEPQVTASPWRAIHRTDDEMIDKLRQLPEATRRALPDSLLAMEERAGGDMPNDLQDQLQVLAQKLQEFTRQQRRVIEATKNLAKKPVEDFSTADEQLLKELAAIEDDWARFLEETHSDWSKLPEQDFANPSLLQELVEVQTEIKMAADALTKKSIDIAVPLEQLGAEMAEELVTNIEKWLPDTPDRERWSQEEPLADAMKEAPMAELPGELEDLVGELMEEEEALFDEMEDISSSWADSLDQGAGWDAMDGPISNMSAKGVTGNRLPNTSEIGGRSGEGRQGKASGEFVADSAVGKGGRKTPSRLAPDPFVQGQVKDFSKDPVGGATGGGKESGAGGEGLEGPVPSQVQRDLKRMAAKQADLRNRAESVDLKFQILNYHPTDLQKLIQQMAAVERDLKSGRYQSALRRRDVMLDGLRNIKTYLTGEFEIRKDQTSNLPSDIQRELLNGMQETSPKGWESLNREYFQRLSESEMESQEK